MPEYLAPGVYVEEVQTGSKPIEGVSTSTAGMVGVTERGPVNVPILMTSLADFYRWFGGYLNIDDFSNSLGAHCYLPHAVAGFFTNGGKRVYVIRALDSDNAAFAETMLFGRSEPTDSLTLNRLLAEVDTNSDTITVTDSTDIAEDTWLRVDTGSAEEYLQVANAPDAAAANDILLRLPLTNAYGNDTSIQRIDLPDLSATTNLAEAVTAGETKIKVSDTSQFVADRLLRIGTEEDQDDEYVFIDSVNETSVTLRRPLQLAHVVGADVGIFQEIPDSNLYDVTTLERNLRVGASVLFLPVPPARPNPYTIDGNYVLVGGIPLGEVRRIGTLGSVELTGTHNLGVSAYEEYPAGSTVEGVTISNSGRDVKALTKGAAIGSNAVHLNNREHLDVGNLLRIGAENDENVEYLRIKAIQGRLPAPDPGIVMLNSALQADHPENAEVALQVEPTRITPPSATALVLGAVRNSNRLILGRYHDYGPNVRIAIRLPDGRTYYHRVASANPTHLTPLPVELKTPANQPHPIGAPVQICKPLLRVRALDPGAWSNNRLRVAVHDQEPPLLDTTVTEIMDSTHIRLAAVNGVEAGTLLQCTDANGKRLDQPFKVINIARRQNNLLTLSSNLPGATSVGDRVRTLEFKLVVSLLRQPDPAVPTRNEQVLESESFPNLSMDPLHSRYVQRIIGTTFTIGNTKDDDGKPLQLEDRRSEGASEYIRVRDLAQDLQDPQRTTEVESIRMGPQIFVRVLTDGNDAVQYIDEDTYIGNDYRDPERRSGIHALRNNEEISIVAVPGVTRQRVQRALIEHCELMRYRFAVIDGEGPPHDTLTDVQLHRQNYDTRYAALYHPWVFTPDPFPKNPLRSSDYAIPSSGHIMGIYARTDVNRGVHKAPANEIINGIMGLTRILNKGEHDILNPLNINVIRDFRTHYRGIRVWGARVMTSDPDWKYINVRRLLMFIEASIERGLQWVVFEPNSESLWARVSRSISNFLTTVWRSGALEGASVEEAFFVKCDRTTMTQTDIDNGRLICVVGVAPVKPAEFVIIRIGLWTAHTEE